MKARFSLNLCVAQINKNTWKDQDEILNRDRLLVLSSVPATFTPEEVKYYTREKIIKTFTSIKVYGPGVSLQSSPTPFFLFTSYAMESCRQP